MYHKKCDDISLEVTYASLQPPEVHKLKIAQRQDEQTWVQIVHIFFSAVLESQ